MTHPEQERRYYTVQVILAVVAGGIFALIFAVGFLVARTAEARVWAAICLAVFVALALRALKMGVYSSPRHLKIVNTWKTHSLSWSQVAKVGIGRTSWGAIMAFVECDDGRRIVCSAVEHSWLSTVERAHEAACGTIVRQLRRDLARYSRDRHSTPQQDSR